MKRQVLGNLYQFLYHVTPVFIFQVKSWSDSTFCCFVHRELVSTLLKDNPAFYLVIIQSFLNFSSIPRIGSAERIRGIGRNFKSWSFFIFLYWSREGTVLIHQVTNNKCLRNIATKISQSLSILVSRDPCCCLSSKKLVWLNFLLKFQVFKFSYTSAFFQKFWNLAYYL